MKRNIFCFVGNTGTGKNFYMDELIQDNKFITKYNLSALVYGTTRAPRSGEKEGIDYHFLSKEQFEEISESDKIETRSYYTLNDGEIYYFTKPEYFEYANTSNLLCITSPYQYEHYRNWCANENIKGNDFNLHMILIETSLKIRINRVINHRVEKDNDIYELCRRIIDEKMEYDNVAERLPELKDPVSHNNVLIINNNGSAKSDIDRNLDRIKIWIKSRLIL